MKETALGIIMNGVTGRMGSNQHLERSIVAIRNQEGIRLSDGHYLMPEPILVGRDEGKLKKLADSYGIAKYTTQLDTVLSDPFYKIYFDAQVTNLRPEALRKAMQAGKAVYCEKPTAGNTRDALQLAMMAEKLKLKNGVVQDKLWLPGLQKLKYLVDTHFFGRILSVRGEFGYWVFDGFSQTAQRPSWNYRKADGGGIIMDMFCHWQYVLENLFGKIEAVSALGAIHIERRVDEKGQIYESTAEDAAYGTFMLEDGIVCQFNSSWDVRVRRDDLLMIQVDGTQGSAVAGLRDCYIQNEAMTPKPVWNPDIPSTINYYENWAKIPDRQPYDNAFKVQWEKFLLHVAQDEPFPWTLREGAKGVQLAELGIQSWKEKRWLSVPPLVNEI